jgi:5'(3')-deoxyribonucleotidase
MKPKRVLIDMDGVLADFMKGLLKAHKIDKTVEEVYANHLGIWLAEELLGMTSVEFWKPIDYRFWENLPVMTGAQDIIELAEKLVGRVNVFLWTSPCANEGCFDGKRAWIKKHLHRQYQLKNLIAGSAKFLGASPTTVLIDDADHNIDAFHAAGGIPCLVPRLWNREHAFRHQAIDTVERRLYYAGKD